MKTWFKIRALADKKSEISLHDEIGAWGIEPSELVRQIGEIDATEIVVGLNSPGGDVSGSIAIVNALRSHPARIVVRLDAVAASMASVILASADHVIAPKNTAVMIHDPWTIVMGDATELRKSAETLEMFAGQMLDEYVRRAGEENREPLRAAMVAETWYTATEAQALGFVDELIEPVALRAVWSKERFKASAPAALIADLEDEAELAVIEPVVETVPVALDAPADPAPAVEPAVVEPEVIELTEPQIAAIRKACLAANLPEQADALISAKATDADAIITYLFRARAEQDKNLVIDNKHQPDAAPVATRDPVAELRARQFARLNPKK